MVVPAGAATPHGQPTKLPHCILEFTAGTAADGVTIPRSSRIILRFGDEPIECDEQFLAMAPSLAMAAGAGLVSGLNGLAGDGGRATERAWVLELIRAWSAVRAPRLSTTSSRSSRQRNGCARLRRSAQRPRPG